MLSLGGKVIWNCPFCKSQNIDGPHKELPIDWYADGAILVSSAEKAGLCNQCGNYFPWRERIKRSTK